MVFDINKENELYSNLINKTPKWWTNLVNDPEIYIDIRKNNNINVYYNGGSIIKLSWSSKKGYDGKIHYKFIPIQSDESYLSFIFDNNNLSFDSLKTIQTNNFDNYTLKRIKNNIKQYYPNSSEKGIQAKYVISSYENKINGIFLDTELQYNQNELRIDMIWLDFDMKLLSFVELKTIGDQRLFCDSKSKKESIIDQLCKYEEFISSKTKDLLLYYNEVFSIKKSLGIISEKRTKVKSIENYKIIEKPILLIGDCSQVWINNNSANINDRIKKHSYACIYHGLNNTNFRFPNKSAKNIFVF